MQKKTVRQIIFLLCLALCIGMTACGNDDAAGADWRTTGVVAASGTITHDGESVDVLVTVDPDNAMFYWDQEEQVLYDSVHFPERIDDASNDNFEISFDDWNDDGESDVIVHFYHEMSESQLVWLWDAEERYVYQPELSYLYLDVTAYDPSDETPLERAAGLWEYTGDNVWFQIYSDASWEMRSAENEILAYGVAVADEEGVDLHYDSTGDVLHLDFAYNGTLLDAVNNGVLVRVDEIVPTSSPFEANSLLIGCEADKGTYLLQNGVSGYSDLGSGYRTDDCYWEVIRRRDDTYDGMREIEFDAVCYIPQSSLTDSMTVVNTDSELYDFYTGMWLTAAASYNGTARGENHYLHTVNWGGKSYEIEFFYSTDWQYNVSDWAMVLTKSYVVYLPEDYDGLIFAAEAQPDNYRDLAKRQQLDSICPEAGIMECQTVDPYSSLYFAICY